MPIHNPYDGEVIQNTQLDRFEIQAEDQVAILQYHLNGNSILFTHTYVPPELEGHMLGSRLVRAGLEYARQNSLRVDSACWFVDRFIDRHPEYAALRDG